LEEGEIGVIFVQIVLALHHCHHWFPAKWTLMHRDLKPENGKSALSVVDLKLIHTVLMTAQGRIKLADFGLSTILGTNSAVVHSLVGVSILVTC
jgi:serine/threonine protein kinase